MIPLLTLDNHDGIRAACREYGFFMLSDHGISFDRELEVATRYFAQPILTKLAERNSTGGAGYIPMKQESLNPLAGADHKEALNIRGEDSEFTRQCWTVANSILDTLSLLDIDFASKHGEIDGDTTLRYLHYPPIQEPQIVAGEHTDYGSLTLLFTTHPGLQVRHNGQWLDVPVIPNTAIVNIGDLMHIWSKGAYKSSLHRVLNTTRSDRYSIALFIHPNRDTLITNELTAGQYLKQRLAGTHGVYSE